ncbi:MAG: hypothetical protein Tsb002_05330 [Wenzhouxiangellaceae bacterium]
MLVIPPEHLDETGISEEWRESLLTDGLVTAAWVTCFNQAYTCYWQRLTGLHKTAPDEWFPPRAQHVCLIVDRSLIRPYFQPFHRSAWLLYAEDFDPETSNLEFAVFQLIQAERMGVLQQVVPALISNLSYWLTRSDAEASAFVKHCQRIRRPDQQGWRALARAMPWIRHLHHPRWRPPGADTVSKLPIDGTRLLISRSRQQDLQRLVVTFTRAAQATIDAYFGQYRRPSGRAGLALCSWLQQTQPRVLITAGKGEIVWDFSTPQKTDAVQPLLESLPETVSASLRDDLMTVGRCSQSFVDSLSDLARLPAPNPASADQNGLSYMHITRAEVAYNLHEAGMQRLREPAPPYERLMLAARTIHEWGHLAVEAGWVPLTAAGEQEQPRLLQTAAALFNEMIALAPVNVRQRCGHSLRRLGQSYGTTPDLALARLCLARIEDFQANLLARRYLNQDEMETYARNNHRTHVHDYPRDAYFQRLARYAYEYQYLRFTAIADQWSYFIKTTWFAEQYLNNGIVDESRVRELFACVGRLCDGYAVDQRYFQS